MTGNRDNDGGMIQVMELFGPTIQGEGIMTGTVTHFLRTGGCSLRCSWCDSLFAVLPDQIKKHRKLMTTAEILDAIDKLPYAPYITFTGGDPAIQDRLGDMIITLNSRWMRVAVETQGMFFPAWFDYVDVLTFSPKGPSSGNVVDPKPLLDWLVDHSDGRRRFKTCIKIVCFNEDDFAYALDAYKLIHPSLYDAFYFTAGTPAFEEGKGYDRVGGILVNQQALAEMMLKNTGSMHLNNKVHLGCQQHVLLWPTEDRGV